MMKSCLGLRLAAFALALPLSLTACFRDTSEVMEQQAVAREYASPTAIQELEPIVLVPSATEEPTATAMPATALPATALPATAEETVDAFALSATALIAQMTQPVATGPAALTGDATQPAVGATQIPLIRATIPPGQDCVHEIRAGDTLYQLSLAYGVTVDAIAVASAIQNPDRIAVGQRIIIPKCGTTGFIPPPTSIPPPTADLALIPPTAVAAELEVAAAEDDTIDTLVEQAQASLLGNAQANEPAVVSAQLAAADPPTTTYTVQQNDTLFEIANRFGTTVEVLAALNNIADVDSVGAGEVLDIP